MWSWLVMRELRGGGLRIEVIEYMRASWGMEAFEY